MLAELVEYFARQNAIPYIGPEGLQKLRSSSIGIAGVGGVGSAAAYYLARSGIGRLLLVDQDIVEPSNLQRLHAASPDDIFRPKAETVCKAISDLNTWTVAEPIVETITDQNVDQLFQGVDMVVDGLDNFRTRYILNDYSLRSRTRYLFMSAVAQQAHIALLDPPNTACLECVVPQIIDRFQDSCETLGVTPTIIGLVGTLGASVVVNSLLRRSTRLTEDMLTVDLEGPEFLYNKLLKRQNCDACSTLGRNDARASPIVTSLCGEHTANVLPPSTMRLNLSEISASLPSGKILLKTDSVLVFRHGRFRVSLFPNGRLLIAGVDKETIASKVAHEVFQTIRGS